MAQDNTNTSGSDQRRLEERLVMCETKLLRLQIVCNKLNDELLQAKQDAIELNERLDNVSFWVDALRERLKVMGI